MTYGYSNRTIKTINIFNCLTCVFTFFEGKLDYFLITGVHLLHALKDYLIK